VEQSRKKRDSGRKRQIYGFALAGSLALVVDAVVLSAGVAIGLPVIYARIPSFLVAVLTTWHLNRSFTFQTKKPRSVREFIHYLSAMSFGWFINLAVFVVVIFVSDLARGIPALALIPAAAAGMIVNFLTSRHILTY